MYAVEVLLELNYSNDTEQRCDTKILILIADLLNIHCNLTSSTLHSLGAPPPPHLVFERATKKREKKLNC